MAGAVGSASALLIMLLGGFLLAKGIIHESVVGCSGPNTFLTAIIILPPPSCYNLCSKQSSGNL